LQKQSAEVAASIERLKAEVEALRKKKESVETNLKSACDAGAVLVKMNCSA